MSSQAIISEKNPSDVVKRLQAQLTRSEGDSRRIVLMTCGIAGSGKTTLSKEVIKEYPNFQRMSIDEIIASHHGIYKVDYEPDMYDHYQEEADEIFLKNFQESLASGKADVILDRSFYAKEDRDEFKALVEKCGARWVLVHIKASKALLWKRIIQRRDKGVDANSALEISEDLLEKYVRGFEYPDGEGEIVVEYVE